MKNYLTLKKLFEETPLFKNKSWQLSPEPFYVSEVERLELKAIGAACLQFYKAVTVLYNRSAHDKSLLRNTDYKAPWVADYYNRGKPKQLINHSLQGALKNQLPCVIRPDLLLTEKGFILTELDCVPGGIGLTTFLNETYQKYNYNIIQNPEGMAAAFYKALLSCVSENPKPYIAIVISDESQDYRPEMEWICHKLQKQHDASISCCHPNELIIKEDGIYIQQNKKNIKVDLIYRFFELFDLPQFPHTSELYKHIKTGTVKLTPPMRPFQEEKLSLALFHHPKLKLFWKEQLPADTYSVLYNLIPNSWILDSTPLPAGAFWHGPTVNHEPIHDWRELGEAGTKERALILKISGFHETAWGARSVVLGSDVSRLEWKAAIEKALNASESSVYILQDYHKPKRITHTAYDTDGKEYSSDYRVRLCPYYFISNDQSHLGGALATLCPPDKKIIHGMETAILLPSS
jgi:hypothetical protein